MAKKRSPRTAKVSRTAKTPKASKTSKRAAQKPSAKRAPAKKKTSAKKRAVKQPSGSAKKVSSAKASAKRKGPAGKRPAALGRPRVPGTAELDQMFLKDYEARQVFEFLGVRTLKELEEHPPDEIVERLTDPMVRTVDRIRKALAVNNRYLAGDQKFAVQFARQIR